MTSNRRSELGEIDMERGLISLDLDYGKVVHIPENPIDTEIVRIQEGLNEIGIDLLPENRGNVETVHTLKKIKLGTRSSRKKGDPGMLLWMP